MKKGYSQDRTSLPASMMAYLGGLGAVTVVLLRVWLSPSQRDMDTGLYITNTPVIVLTLILLAAMLVMALLLRGVPRREIAGKPAMGLSVVLLAAGAVLLFTCVAELLRRWGILPGDEVQAVVTPLGGVLQALQPIVGVLGGAAMIRSGLCLASEGSTRRGMIQWGLLAPVLWMWFKLANYEMSYASMVRLSDGYFTLLMYIMEMAFLFCLARYFAGVGKDAMGLLMFTSAGAALFAVSAPLVRVLMYLLQDSEAYAAAGAANYVDLGIGLLALTVCVTLCQSLSAPAPVSVEESASPEEDSKPSEPDFF